MSSYQLGFSSYCQLMDVRCRRCTFIILISYLRDFFSDDVIMLSCIWMYCIYSHIPCDMCGGCYQLDVLSLYWLYLCFSYVAMYLLFLYVHKTLYLKLKLINLNILNVTQRKGTLEESKLYLYLLMCI